MEKEVLVILMVAFGLFAIIMFILFFVYLKKYYNNRHIDDDYKKDLDKKILEDDEIEPINVDVPKEEVDSFEEFVPIKKK